MFCVIVFNLSTCQKSVFTDVLQPQNTCRFKLHLFTVGMSTLSTRGIHPEGAIMVGKCVLVLIILPVHKSSLNTLGVK